MQNYEKIAITPDQIIPIARDMHDRGIMLTMIHGYVDHDGQTVISYDYAQGDTIESYTVTGFDTLPSIADIYSEAAAWPELELYELMGVTFEGLDTSRRLFLPEDMLDARGQILVQPMDELIQSRHPAKDAQQD